jgi:hypothetical protein
MGRALRGNGVVKDDIIMFVTVSQLTEVVITILFLNIKESSISRQLILKDQFNKDGQSSC